METNKTSEPALLSYGHLEILKKSTEYFNGDEMAANVWMNKYALKDSEDNIYELTPDDMHKRLAKEFARVEAKYPNPLSEEEIYALLKNFKYIVPQGSPMSGIGNKFQIMSLSNCFVIGNNGQSDSYGGILKIDQEQVQLMKRRGGVGHDLSHIRPKGSGVKNSALTSTGIVPFMERYSNSTREVAQDGRRGALMLSISIKHPEAENFIDAKMTPGKITGANVSVKISDDFMQALISEKPFVQQYPINSENPKFSRETDPKILWNKIIHNAWDKAEPGVLFWDTVIRESVPDCYSDLGFQTVSTNPCGEIPLCPYDSCRLIAINLYSYVEKAFTKEAKFNFDLFKKHVQIAQRLMDDLIDMELENIDKILEKIEKDPEEEDVKRIEQQLWLNIKMKCIEGRRTGLGITAEGDMLAGLNLRYASDEAIKFSVEVQKTLSLSAYRSSVIMARERGAFPIFRSERERNNPYINRLREADAQLYEDMLKYGRRNIALLTIAPTGSVSICTQTSSGIEPVFSIYYTRRRKVNPNDVTARITFTDEQGDAWEEYNVIHHKFLEWMTANGYDAENAKMMKAAELDKLIEKSPYFKATANDIDWLSKVKLQGAIQKWVDHSISVTVNLPKDTTEELVDKIYRTAWEAGCKGMTIYRDGSREGVLVQNSDAKAKEKVQKVSSRPRVLEADVVRFTNNKEKWIAVVGLLNNKPYEIFTGNAEDLLLHSYVTKGQIVRIKNGDEKTRYDFVYLDKAGYERVVPGLSRTFNEDFWNYAIIISGILRHGTMPIQDTINLISKLKLRDDDSINTWKVGVIRALKKYIPDGTVVEKEKCPECGEASLVYEGGCVICRSCGYSKCG